MRVEKEAHAESNDHRRAVDRSAFEGRGATDLPRYDHVDLCTPGFVELAACHGFPEELPRMVSAAGQEVLLLLGSRVTETWRGSLPCRCLDAEGLPATEARQAWLVATRADEDRSGPQSCWVYSQVCVERDPERPLAERVSDARAWWLDRFGTHRNAVVVRPTVGSVMAFKHIGRSADAWRWFRLRRYRGVETIALHSFLVGRGYFPSSQRERTNQSMNFIRCKPAAPSLCNGPDQQELFK